VRQRRWRRRIESGQAKVDYQFCEQEGVTDAYACRLLPLTCLAPDIVEAILDGVAKPRYLARRRSHGTSSDCAGQPVPWSALRHPVARNTLLQRRIAHLLKRPVGRPPRRFGVYYGSFRYHAQTWSRLRRVVANVEWHPGELNLALGS
jgi:hypothetical protein